MVKAPPKDSKGTSSHSTMKGVLPTKEELEAQRLAAAKEEVAKRKRKDEFVEVTEDQHYRGEHKGEKPEEPKEPKATNENPDRITAAIPPSKTPFAQGEGFLDKADHLAAAVVEDLFDTMVDHVNGTTPNNHPAPKGFADANKDGRSDLVQNLKEGDHVKPHDALPQKPPGGSRRV